MKRWRLTIGLALTAGSIVWGASTSHALPPGSAPTGGLTISPTSGDASTAISLGLVAPNNTCPGDTVTGDYRWNMYVAADAVDAGTVTWTPGGAGAPSAPGGGFVQVMNSSVLRAGQLSRPTAVETGQIVGVPTVDFLSNTIPGDGVYNIGFSCTRAPVFGQADATERFWQTMIRVTEWVSPTNFTWATVEAAPLPSSGLTLSPESGDSSTQMMLMLTAPDDVCPGDTATGNYRWNTFMAPSSVDVGALTYNDQGPISPPGAGVRPLFSAVGFAALVNRETAVQTGQIVGAPFASFSMFSPGEIAPGVYKIGYACTKAPVVDQPGVTERYWQVEIDVTANSFGGAAHIDWTATGISAGIPIAQTVTATKLSAGGALIINQRCGSFGVLPAVFDADLGLLIALPAFGGEQAPSLNCIAELGTTRLLNQGPRQGLFYGATGRINQITVIDTRPGSLPWTVSAQVGSFTNAATSETFSGELLGWQPFVSSAIDAAGNFDSSVIAGPAIEPSIASTGLPRTLATAPPGKTAGLVQLDARLKLLIPATVADGRYSATITFTVI